MKSEAAANADFTRIRYAQCWEDADILLEALNIQPGDTCLSICSAGDNSLAMLARDPARVIALDLSRTQLACLELRVAAYRTLKHHELLELIGATQSLQRAALYLRCRDQLATETRQFWDQHPEYIEAGIGTCGKFENYFRLFRSRILPLVHARRTAMQLLAGGDLQQRQTFYTARWDTWRWRLLFKLFFSRHVMGRFGRDPAFFKYVEGSVADRILARARHALTELNPAENPYLQWIVAGRFTTALPFALRPENFEPIRRNLHKLEWHHAPIESLLDQLGPRAVHRFNLSDIFEYMSLENYRQLLGRIVTASAPGARLAYWNMLAPRSRPEAMKDRLIPQTDLARRLHQADRAFFYSAFIVEEVAG